MKNTITNLWNGRIEPYAHCGEENTEMKLLTSLIERNHSVLYRELTNKQKELLEKYTDCCDEYMLLLSEQAFCDGFCLGARLLSEALSE